MAALPRLYDDLAAWWPLLSSPDDYATEAAFYLQCITDASRVPAKTMLEIGSGGAAWTMERSDSVAAVINLKRLAKALAGNPWLRPAVATLIRLIDSFCRLLGLDPAIASTVAV